MTDHLQAVAYMALVALAALGNESEELRRARLHLRSRLGSQGVRSPRPESDQEELPPPREGTFV